jgi:hypothetical protein
MTKETSSISWSELSISGRLSTRRSQSLSALALHGPGTASEIHKASAIKMNKNDFANRLKELRIIGFASEDIETRQCQVTGQTCTIWRVIQNAIPDFDALKKPKKSPDELKRLRIESDSLRLENSYLKSRVNALEKENQFLKSGKGGQLGLGL